MGAANLVSAVYVSSAVRPLKPHELREMLSVIRRQNELRGITGMLLYRSGNFLQVVEGPAPAINRLLQSLQRDPRHTGMIILNKKPIQQREFAEWHMAFRDISDLYTQDVEGYSHFMEFSFTSPELLTQPSLSLRLLQQFKEGLR